jgi:hypothetical protein
VFVILCSFSICLFGSKTNTRQQEWLAEKRILFHLNRLDKHPDLSGYYSIETVLDLKWFQVGEVFF